MIYLMRGGYWPCVRTLRGGGPQNACTCVQRGGGGQKRPKNCVRTIWTAPNGYSAFKLPTQRAISIKMFVSIRVLTVPSLERAASCGHW